MKLKDSLDGFIKKKIIIKMYFVNNLKYSVLFEILIKLCNGLTTLKNLW